MRKTPPPSEEEEEEEGDRLSNLPEGVLCHILSFLGTEEACRTSILSRSWRSLWTLLPDVSFHYYCPLDRSKSFDRFVNKVLDSRKPPAGQGIRKFYLLYDGRSVFYQSDLEAWIRGAIGCRAQELELDLDISVPRTVQPPPLSVFNSETITSLKLCSQLCFTPSPDAWLPSLKVLDMKNAFYDLDKLVPTLLSACPALEELSMGGFHCRDLNIPSPKLNKLSLTTTTLGDGTHAHLEIDAPSLRYLSLGGHRHPRECVIKNMDNLTEARIFVELDRRDNGWFFNLFRGLSHVKSLFLCVHEPFGFRGNWFDGELEQDSASKLPEFPTLTRLHFGETSYLYFLSSLLQKSPKLQVLIIERRYFRDVMWTKPQEVPHCLSSSLIHFTYKGFLARREEFEKLEYICKNSSVLKTMTIQPAESLTLSLRIYEEVARIPKSKSCEVKFEPMPFHPNFCTHS